jgi:4-methylaminobutanoate oxidase (formaldehyde-forming)
MERAGVVVIGGGIAGCSAAYHLAKLGVKDVLLLEKAELTSGSTHHAAGLVTQFNPSAAMMRLRRSSIELYRSLGVFETVGSVRIASTAEGLVELWRAASRAAGIGLEVEQISAREAAELLPGADPATITGAIWLPEDGHVDPHIATHALADAARALGARIRLHSRVLGLELGLRGEVQAVLTESGPIETERVVNAAGIWAPRVAAMAGTFIPSVPVDHQHVAMAAVAGSEIGRDAPCFRDVDNLVYGRGESGGMLVGGYEHDPVSRWSDGVPWEHGSSPVPSDMERFAPLLEGAIRRFPFLEESGVIRLLCHPDAMTPDGNPLLGPTPAVPGLWTLAGLSLNGFGGAGGLGASLAEWMTAGSSELDVDAYRAWRFGALYRDEVVAAEAAREAYRYYYRLRYPLDELVCGRGRRLSALHSRLQELGAVFTAKNGWERAGHFEPGRPWRRAGEDQRAFGWSAPPYLEELAAEHEAFRERAGIIDLSSFGKISVEGPAALALLERVCDNRIDRPVGSVVYTQFLNARGGIVADVTVTRLEEERFRVVTGAGAVDSDLGWLCLALGEGGGVTLRDESAELAAIGLWGPRSREILAAVTDDDVSNEAISYRRAAAIAIGGASVLAQRITFVGELGFELYVAPRWAVQVWDRLMAAGAAHGIRAGGYRVLDSLRIEKGNRYFGTDLTASDTPFEGGVGFCVASAKEFIGSAALAAGGPPRRRLRTLLVGGGEYLRLYGGEAVRLDGEVAGRVRSCAYAFTLGRNVALASVPADLQDGAEVAVEVLGEPVVAVLAPDVLYDPDNSRIRA